MAMVEKLNDLGESSVTVKAVFLISLVCAFIGAGFTLMMNHEMRISRVEACMEGMKYNAELTQKIVLSIREDQVAFYRANNPKWKSSHDFDDDIFRGGK